MIEYVEKDLGSLVAIKVVKPICQKDYNTLIPEIEKKIQECGRINFYLELKDGVEWNAKSFWSDINFNLKHAQDIRKVALVGKGNEQLEEKIIELFKPLENAEIRWYNPSEKEEAMNWVKI